MKNLKDKLVSNIIRCEISLQFVLENIPADSRNPLPFRRLSAKPPRLSACGVSARQYFGRSVAYFFHPMRITGEKNLKDNLVLNLVRDETGLHFFLLKHKGDWNGRDETPAGKAWPRETPQARRGGSRPPAESECLEWKSTFPFYKPRKKLSANKYYLVLNKRVLSK